MATVVPSDEMDTLPPEESKVASPLAWDSRPADPSPGAVARMIDTVVGCTTIVFILISLYTGINGSGNIGFDVIWIAMVFLYSFTDARKIYLHITDIHIASDAES